MVFIEQRCAGLNGSEEQQIMDREADIRFDFARRLGQGDFPRFAQGRRDWRLPIGDWGFQRRLRQTNPICAGRRAKRTQFARGPAGPGNPKLEILNKSEMPMIETDPKRKTKPMCDRISLGKEEDHG